MYTAIRDYTHWTTLEPPFVNQREFPFIVIDLVQSRGPRLPGNNNLDWGKQATRPRRRVAIQKQARGSHVSSHFPSAGLEAKHRRLARLQPLLYHGHGPRVTAPDRENLDRWGLCYNDPDTDACASPGSEATFFNHGVSRRPGMSEKNSVRAFPVAGPPARRPLVEVSLLNTCPCPIR